MHSLYHMKDIRKSIHFLQQHIRKNGDTELNLKCLDLLVEVDKKENKDER